MLTRGLKFDEVKEFKWKMYPMNINEYVTKEHIVNFLAKLYVKTGEIDQGYPVYFCTTSVDIIIFTKKNEKIMGRYNHIYRNNSIQIEIDGKFQPWSRVKNKIQKIIFMDDINLHEDLRSYWSERGFRWDLEAYEKTKVKILQETQLVNK